MEYAPRIGRDPEVPELLESRDEDEYVYGLDQDYYDQLGSETVYDTEENIEEISYPTQEEYDQLGTEFHSEETGQII
jgi:hypothetical protein